MLNIETKICLDQYIYEVTEKSSKLPSLSTMVQVLISIVQSQSLELLAKLELVVFSWFWWILIMPWIGFICIQNK